MDGFDDYVSFFSAEAQRWGHSEDVSLGHRTDDHPIFTDLGGQCWSDFFRRIKELPPGFFLNQFDGCEQAFSTNFPHIWMISQR